MFVMYKQVRWEKHRQWSVGVEGKENQLTEGVHQKGRIKTDTCGERKGF